MLERAVEIVGRWNRIHGTDFSVSVNLSGLHFKGDDALGFVVAALGRHDFPARSLTLEITETTQIANWQAVGRELSVLRGLGCRISIDDFGAGYSSLAYLRKCMADELKIDRSLVQDIDTSPKAQFILDAVLDLARSLELSVVAEGIERDAQLDSLVLLGCEIGQGYLFGKPAPAEQALGVATHAADNTGAIAAKG